MRAAEFLPRERTRINAIGHFARKENSGDVVPLQHRLVRRNCERHFARAQLGEHSGIHKMRDHDVHIRLRRARLADDAFQSPNAIAPRVSRVLIIIHGKLDK